MGKGFASAKDPDDEWRRVESKRQQKQLLLVIQLLKCNVDGDESDDGDGVFVLTLFEVNGATLENWVKPV